MKLERTPDDQETLSLIFRLVHTIKGTCGFLGLPRLEHVAHAAENVLGKVRDGVLTATPDTVTPGADGGSTGSRRSSPAWPPPGAEPAGDDSELVERAERGGVGRGARNRLPPPCRPSPEPEAEPAPEQPGRTARRRQAAAAAPVVSRRRRPAQAAPDAAPGEPVATNQTIRVTVDVLEDLMTLVSELVLTRNQLLQLARTQENSGFTVPLQRLSHITSDLQEGVMKTRMQPIGNAWNKLPRLVRDLSRARWTRRSS